MPRGRSNSNSSKSSYGSKSNTSANTTPTTQTKTSQPAPSQANHQNLPTQQTTTSGGMMSGLGSTLVSGMAFGAGSEVAHQAVRGLMGSGSDKKESSTENKVEQSNQTKTQQQQQHQNICSFQNQKFVNCLKENGNDISECQNFFNDLKACEKQIL